MLAADYLVDFGPGPGVLTKAAWRLLPLLCLLYIFNILNRRMIMWPFLINCMLCLWVGIVGISNAAASPAWDAWTKKFENLGILSLDHMMGQFRAIAPGMVMLTLVWKPLSLVSRL